MAVLILNWSDEFLFFHSALTTPPPPRRSKSDFNLSLLLVTTFKLEQGGLCYHLGGALLGHPNIDMDLKVSFLKMFYKTEFQIENNCICKINIIERI